MRVNTTNNRWQATVTSRFHEPHESQSDPLPATGPHSHAVTSQRKPGLTDADRRRRNTGVSVTHAHTHTCTHRVCCENTQPAWISCNSKTHGAPQQYQFHPRHGRLNPQLPRVCGLLRAGPALLGRAEGREHRAVKPQDSKTDAEPAPGGGSPPPGPLGLGRRPGAWTGAAAAGGSAGLRLVPSLGWPL